MPNLSSDYQKIPAICSPYDYDNPGPPFNPESIAAIDAVKNFLSDAELARARQFETVSFNPVAGFASVIFIPGLRYYEETFCFYVTRYNQLYYEDLMQGFLDRVYDGYPKAKLGGIFWAWFRVTTPDGNRHYPFEFHGDLQAWKDRMVAVAKDVRTTLASFDRGKFCLTDGRKFAFGDLTIDRLEAGKPIPEDW